MFASTFEQEERIFRNRKASIAAISTVVVHALIFLFLLWMILSPPNPPYTDSGGVSVNFGTDLTGMGDEQPMTLTPIQADFTPPPAASSKPQPAQQEELVTQDVEDAPVMETKKTDAPKQKPDENALFKPTKTTTLQNTTTKNQSTQPAQPVQQADPNALFKKGALGTPNSSKGDGKGNTPGDQGKPDGDPHSKNYLGDGSGDGSGGGKGDLSGGYNLRGRSKISLPPPSQCSSRGKVVVSIKVDKTGKVVEATLKRLESTVFDECNVNNALNAARKATFSPEPNAPEIQEGTITYIYKIN